MVTERASTKSRTGRPTPSAPDDDPYLWLEQIEGARALNFVERQNSRTLQVFGGPAAERDRDALTAIYDRPDNIPYVSRRGGYLYNLWRDANNPRGLWRRTTLEEYRSLKPSWDVLLDLDQLAVSEGEDWLLNATVAPPGSHSRWILSLSRGGSDAVTLREFDTDTKLFIRDGFILPEAKGSGVWFDSDTLVLLSSYGDGMAATTGYARTVRLWRRGTHVDQAAVIFETKVAHVSVDCSVDDTVVPPRIWFLDATDVSNCVVWLGDETGAKTRLDLPSNIWMRSHRNWLALKPRESWSVAGQTYAADTVLVIPLPAFLAGSRQFEVLFEPGLRRALQSFFWAAGKLVLCILDELRPVFEICTPSDYGWNREQLAGLPDLGVVEIWSFDRDPSESNGDLLAHVEDPLTPPSLILMERGVTSPAVLKQAPKTFAAEQCVVTWHEAISIDGERIPYLQTGPVRQPGNAPVHMSGYGGFGISVKPYYNSAR